MGIRTLLARAQAMLLPAAVLVVGFAITAAVVRGAVVDIETGEQAAFTRQAEVLKAEVGRRLQLAAVGLSAMRGLHAAAGSLDPGQLQRYVQRRDMEREFPGLRGFGVIERIPRAELQAFEQRQQQLGTDGFQIRTSGDRPDLFVIRSVEPIERNRAALGFDSGSNPLARAALEHAVDTGITTMTAPLRLQQDENNGLGWVLYTPVFQGEPRSVDQRRDSLAMVVFTPLPARDLLATVPDQAGVDADFRLYDEGAGHQLVFDAAPAARTGARESWQTLVAGDRVLAVQVIARPGPAAGAGVPWLVAAFGCLLSMGLALLTWRQVTGRQRAVASADAMRHDVTRLAAIVERTSGAVFTTDLAGNLTWVNPGLEALRAPAAHHHRQPAGPHLVLGPPRGAACSRTAASARSTASPRPRCRATTGCVATIRGWPARPRRPRPCWPARRSSSSTSCPARTASPRPGRCTTSPTAGSPPAASSCWPTR
jgi:CHASE1-domain containing sensor protein